VGAFAELGARETSAESSSPSETKDGEGDNGPELDEALGNCSNCTDENDALVIINISLLNYFKTFLIKSQNLNKTYYKIIFIILIKNSIY
jgi:hypothetical protein